MVIWILARSEARIILGADFATGLAVLARCKIVTEQEALQGAQEVLEYEFNDLKLLSASLTHASIADARVNSNERMEFVGDAILGMIVCQELYERFPEYLEGELTKIKSAVVSRKICAEIARGIGLHKFLFLGKGVGTRSQMPQSLAAAVFESVIAAIFFDGGGLEEARKFVLRVAQEHITQAAESEHQRNFKSQLQQYVQKNLGTTPIYDLLDEKGPDHSKCFEISVVMKGKRHTSAWGPSKKEAEQKAAYLALREMGIIKPWPEYEPEAVEH